MTASDVPALQRMELAAGRLFHDVGMPEIAGDDPPTADELLAAAHVLVAEDDSGVPVGYARVDLVGGQPHLEQLSVPPEHGRQGIGAALLDAAAAWAGEQGALHSFPTRRSSDLDRKSVV